MSISDDGVEGSRKTAVETSGQVSSACDRVIEFTNRGDHAFQVFSELERSCAADHPDVILGAGTVIDAATAATYLNLGANFIVGRRRRRSNVQ